ncbi:MAG: UDP-N-acetylmuramate--L-alanine ligase [Planctomycetota bacterium]
MTDRNEHDALFQNVKAVHMLGIGGAGMSGLARLLSAGGYRVTGADATPSPTTQALVDSGLPVTVGNDSELPAACDLVIASAAVKPEHPGLVAADIRGIPTASYARALGSAMAGRTGIAVAGTHGKSTTAAMLSAAMIAAGLDPSVIVGAACPHLTDEHGRPTGFRVGSERVPSGRLRDRPGFLIAEACEYNRSFHNLRPTIAGIANLEADHLDVYGTLDAVIEAFRVFAAGLPEEGTLLVGHDGAHRREVTRGVRCRVETIGFAPGADWRLSLGDRRGRPALLVEHRGREAGSFVLPMPGEHGAMNAGVAFALAVLAGADPNAAATGLGSFRGVCRRFERLGERTLAGGGSVTVYDDYGHHPTEIDLTIRALREHERIDSAGRRLVCVFQPHQHSRTRFFLEEFAAAFARADAVIVPDIYFVRDSEVERQRVSAGGLVDRLRSRGVKATHVYPMEAMPEHIEDIARPGDVLLVMGAGPVWTVAHEFMRRGSPAATVHDAPIPGPAAVGR